MFFMRRRRRPKENNDMSTGPQIANPLLLCLNINRIPHAMIHREEALRSKPGT
jgi:hypothetical protein